MLGSGGGFTGLLKVWVVDALVRISSSRARYSTLYPNVARRSMVFQNFESVNIHTDRVESQPEIRSGDEAGEVDLFLLPEVVMLVSVVYRESHGSPKRALIDERRIVTSA